MPSKPILFDQGFVDAPDKSTLRDGELSRAKGCEYRLGSSEIHKQPGRSIANSTGLGAAVLNLHRLRYESASDTFIAVDSDGNINEATPGTSMTFSDKMLTETFVGAGLDDLTLSGTYSGAVIAIYDVEIDASVPSPDTFKWRKNKGPYTAGVAVATGATLLSDGISVAWAAIDGHTIGDKWHITGIATRDTTTPPQFSHIADRWIITNGVDRNLVREPGNVTNSPSPYRNLGMVPAGGQTTVVVDNVTSNVLACTEGDNNTEISLIDIFGSFDLEKAITSNLEEIAVISTYHGTITDFAYVEYEFKVNLVDTDRKMFATHIGPTDTTGQAIQYKIEYRIGAEALRPLFDSSEPYPLTVTTLDIDDSVDFAVDNLVVRFSASASFYVNMGINYVRVSSGGATSRNIDEGIRYFVTERYRDSDNVRHESPANIISLDTGPQTAIFAIKVNLPTAISNAFATEFVIYRSLDEVGGGYPFLYEVGITSIEDVGGFWIDDLRLSLTTRAVDNARQYETLTIVFPDGIQATTEVNLPPPDSNLAVPYQGAMVYLPKDSPRRLYYSLPATLSAASLEKVPGEYFLEFLTAQNDSLVSATVSNGGRNLIVYFDAYSMLVNFLPQASDPGKFDQRVKEYVSEKRGAAGRLLTTTFSPDSGRSTLAAAVDSLGLWITNGVGMLKNWTPHMDWLTFFDGITLTDAILVDNPIMRRLEMIYKDGSNYKELHFFYGDMRQDGLPKITGGPTGHDAGWRCKHYTNLSGTWRGWSGDDGSDGFVFNERLQASDASNATNSDGDTDYDVETGDIYPTGLGAANLIVFAYPKFNSGATAKTVSTTGTFVRDGGQSEQPSISQTKDFEIYRQKKIMWHRYCDRFRLRVQDSTNTDMPALVAGEYEFRPVGRGR